ncbi:MAG: periplasmic heavy metal sensor [Candidatus Eisenbacteria bacterium]|nr:periplasmic heavy metal sensor [Candidatus Eisenbacteria bacterium]
MMSRKWMAVAMAGALAVASLVALALAQESRDSRPAPPAPAAERLDDGWDGGPGPMDGPMMHGPGMGGPGMRGPGMRMRGGMAHRAQMLRALDLSPEQREKVADIREREQRKAIGIRAELATAMLDMRKLMREEHPDGRRIDAQIDRIAGLKAGLRKAQVAAMLEMRSLLTPEQLRKWRGMRMG